MIGCIFWEYFVKTWVIFSFMLLHISKNSGRNNFKLKLKALCMTVTFVMLCFLVSKLSLDETLISVLVNCIITFSNSVNFGLCLTIQVEFICD